MRFLENNNSVKYEIRGGDPVTGTIKCMGAKNFATKAMVAAILGSSQSTLHNIPNIGDVEITQLLLESLGIVIERNDQSMIVNPSNLNISNASLPDSRTNRIPILLLSVLLHKFDEVSVPVVGGDDIGKRKVDFHICALESFGANIEHYPDKYIATKSEPLHGCEITLPYPSVGATETCIFLGVLARGLSIIKNIAIEPEITELITMLRCMGAVILFTGNREITIHGVEKLSGTDVHIIGDRIEAASWASLASATDGLIRVDGIKPSLLGNFLSYYKLSGGGYRIVDENSIEFFREGKLRPVSVETDVFPGFSTDWQQPFATVLTQTDGTSTIHETVYEYRFGYLDVLNKLGARTKVSDQCIGSAACRYHGMGHNHSAIIDGKTKLVAIDEPIKVPDLRAGLAYLIVAVIAEGTTILTDADQIERGYGNLVSKLHNTNLKLLRV
jgi:UDP-N-acetylglucosamine 1-carboxyvinyltransferase